MAIADIVKYDQVFEYELKHPATDEPIGVTFELQSANCDAAKAVMRHQANKEMASKSKVSKKSEDIEAITVDRLAACVSGWDWGDNECFEGEGVPEFARANVVRVLSEVDWIFGQINAETVDIENFT